MTTGFISRVLRGFRSSPKIGFALGILACILYPAATQAQTFGCTPAMANDIACENSKPGTPASVWDVSTGDAGDPSIQGFATDISVPQGGTISFKVKTTANAYRLDIYRMGYYSGNGARLIASITPSVSLPQSQPACKTDSSTMLYDCGNWAVSASWTVPSNATSGIYFVHLVRNDTGGDSHIVFVVRNDSSHSNILFQTSDEAWQAYNDWGGSTGVLGGNTLYGGPGAGNWTYTQRAYKVSYNRPFDTRSFEATTWVFGSEYPMVRWLEQNGYDVTYFTHVDGVRNSSLITNHKLYLSVGHDEYWSGPLRANVEAARDAGMNLAFFSGNEVFWKTRWENSIDGSGTPYRTLVCYKETFSEAAIDPQDPTTWTGTWRDPTLSPPADGGRPENNLTGTIFMVNGPGSDDTGISIKVPQADGKMRFWRNTTEASLGSGATATLPPGTLGYEWDVDADNGFRPAGTLELSTASYNLTSDYLLDNGVTYGAGTAVHHMTMHRAASGALVFGAGTVQWSWGLDNNHDNTQGFATPAASKDMQQATVNLFADMGVQPATIQSGLLLSTQSTDAIPPTSTITSPANGATVTVGHAVTISGTATDGGGGVVGGVEASADGGTTWHQASGRGSWSYSFTPGQVGSYTLMSRAVDDSGNIETPGPGVTVSTSGSFSISGTISPSSIGSGTTVTLTGAASKTATADSNGNYTFSGLGSGSFTVTPNRSGYTFNPLSTTVNITTSNVTGVNFAGSSSTGTTYSISGTVTPSSSGSGVTVSLTGAATASALTDASGNFSFSGLANGTYTLTPSKANFAFSPANSTVAVASANVSGVNFAATATAQTLFTTQSPAQVNQSDGPNSNYELGTLIQSTIAGQITAIRFWKDSKETGTHTGHIWSSSGQLLSTVTFAGETASGWQQQALTGPLSINANTTYVVSVNTGATYYVVTTAGLSAQVVNGSLVSVVGNDGVYGTSGAFPTNSYQSSNYFRDVVFAPGATYSVSGNVSSTGVNATVTLSGGASATTMADGSGNFSFPGLSNGSYTVTPTKAGYTFTPSSATATVSGANVTGLSFTAAAIPTYSISGNVSAAGANATVTLTGSASGTISADSSGNFTFTGLPNGGYNVTPTKAGYTFTPASASSTVNGANVTGANFTATVVTYSISGNVSATGSGATVTLGGATSATTTADSSGNFTFTGLSNGSYTVTPAKTGYTFSPTSSPVTVNSGNVAGINFTASLVTYTISGNVSSIGANATVTLTGAASANTTADTSGNYSFTGLPNGSYTVTPTKSGVNFNPTSAPATVNGANVTGLNFGGTGVVYSISGNVSSAGANATVTLSGAASATTTADSSGNFAFTNLSNGSYTVTPTKAGYTFSPTSASAPVNGANVSGVNFTAAVIPTFSISGNVSTNGSSATVTLSGAASATTSADTSGNYTFTGLLNGSYTVTPSKSGFVFAPLNQAVTINSANATGVNFTASVPIGPTIDATAFGDQKTPAKKVVSAAFSTTAANELLLALVGTDVSSASGTNNSVTSVTGGALTWVLVQRTNTQRGTAEIWRAFATAKLSNVTVTANYSLSNVSSITVMSFKGVVSSGTSGSGAIGATGTGNSAAGAATASLVTKGSNSLVVGVVEDWNAPASVTVGANQTLVHQLAVSGLASFWVQRQSAVTPTAGTTVTINDTAPTTDMYNMSICEILAGS
jgi:hypothetical protein